MAEVTGQPGGSREWTFRRWHVVVALVVVVVLAATIGVVSRQSEIGDLTNKNETLTAGKAQAIRQRNARRQEFDAAQQALDAAQLELGGARVFESNCTPCHFRDGGGGIGPQLFRGAVAGRYSEAAEVAYVTGGGVRGMPAFDSVLSAEQIQQVVAYTRAH